MNNASQPAPSAKYNKWKTAWNKDKLKYYHCEEFRDDYTRLEMDSKARIFNQRSLDDVRSVLGEMLTRRGRIKARILSLGCGPGSDLLGILGAVDSVLGSDFTMYTGDKRDKCHTTGVDVFDWDRTLFEEQLDQLMEGSLIDEISYEFFQEDMESFVHDPSTENGLIEDKFDFICLSFADAGRNLELIGTALPQLLTDYGRILVLDNDIRTVRSLSEFGFTCTFVGYNMCMQSRGKDPAPIYAPFEPSPSSPYKAFLDKLLSEGIEELRL